MATKKTIAVVGATGPQAGGLARANLDDADGPFRFRALTRKPDSDKAAALSASRSGRTPSRRQASAGERAGLLAG
jgi:hypothetical protein